MAAEIAIMRLLFAHHAPLVLYSWQNILRKRSLPVLAVCAFTMHSAEAIVCAGSEAIEVLRQQGYQGCCRIIPKTGLDRRYFYPKSVDALREHLGLDGFIVGYAGRLVPEKGVDILLTAVTRVQQPLQVLIIGDGSEKQRLEDLARQLGIGERCYFTGAISQDKLGDYLNALDMLVLPSKTTANWKEQFGRVLVEAMGCKVAVAGSDSGAIPEVIDNPTCIFEEGNVAELTRILETFASNPALRVETAELGYRHAIERYSLERLVQDLLEMWRSIYYAYQG